MKWQCKICNSENIKVIFYPPLQDKDEAEKINFAPTASDFGIFYKLARCENCGIIFSLCENQEINIKQLYANSKDNLYLSQAAERNIVYKRILSHIKSFVSDNARLLDIGCSYGLFLKIAQDNGWRVDGVEISRDACGYSQGVLGLNVFNGELKAANFPENYFDVVTAIDVIEHLPDPKGFLCQIHRILRPGGNLYLVTPNIQSLSARLLRYRWWSYRRMHLYYFSRRTLYEFLRKNNFSVICANVHKKTFKVEYVMQHLRQLVGNKLFRHLLSSLSNNLRFKNRLLTTSLGDIAVTAKKD